MEGRSRDAAARQCGMDRQTLRDWVHRYNADGLTGLFDRAHGGGAPAKLTAAQQATVAEWVRTGPDHATDGVIRWRVIDLRQRIVREFDIELHERSVGKLLRRLGFRRLSVRPRHPQADPAAQDWAPEATNHKKTTPIWSPPSFRPPPVASRSSSGCRTRRVSASKAA
jgi:transposase